MADTSLYTSGAYLARHPSWHSEDSPWKVAQVLRCLERNRLQPLSVCDVGCGVGEVLSLLQPHLSPESRLVGYEIAEAAIAICKTKEREGLRFVHGDFLQEACETFDLVMVLDVLEHLEDVHGFLRAIRPRGRYKLFHIPLELCVQTVLRGTPLLRAWEESGHLHFFTQPLALAALQRAGHTVVDWFYTPETIEAPNLSLLRRLLRWPHRLAFTLAPTLTTRILGGYSLMVLTE